MSAWINPTVFRDLESQKVNPPYREQYDETCSGGDHDLPDDNVYDVDGQILCAGCRRAAVIADFVGRQPNDLMDPPVEAVFAERCDQCGMWRCSCR